MNKPVTQYAVLASNYALIWEGKWKIDNFFKFNSLKQLKHRLIVLFSFCYRDIMKGKIRHTARMTD